MFKRGVPWLIIIVALCAFFPVGIALMIAKLHKDKMHYVTNGKGTAIVGRIFFGIGIFYALMGLTGGLTSTEESSVTYSVTMMLILCCGGGYALIRHGNKYKKMGLAHARYLAIIANSTGGSLDAIAAAYPKPYEEVCRDLQKMIDDGFFPESYLDLHGRQFVSPLIKVHPAAKSFVRKTPVVSEIKHKVVKCPNCNGTNAVTDGKPECEYCGSPLPA